VKRLGVGWSGVLCVVVLSVVGVMSGLESDPLPSRELKLQASHLGFGTVRVGGRKAITTTLVNNSGSSVAITRAVATEPSFKIESPTLPLTLSPGESTSVRVSFNPETYGTYAGHLIIGGENWTQSAVASLSGTSGATVQLSVNPSSVTFGNVSVGGSQTQALTLTNSGIANLTVSQVTVSGSSFRLSGPTLPVTLSPGQSVRSNVSFAPQAGGSASGSISIVMNTPPATTAYEWRHRHGSSATTISLAGTGVGLQASSLAASPSSMGFGNVQIGSHDNLSETLTNTGSSSVTISQVNMAGSTFAVSGLSLPLTLNPGQSANFGVTFSPISAGTLSGNLAIISNASNSTLNIGLSGTAASAAALSVNPSSLSFGSIAMGSHKTLAATLINSGGTSATISGLTASGSGYSVPGLASAMTLGSGQSYTFNVTFAPTSSGSSNGSVLVASNASNTTLSIPLTGATTVLGTLAIAPSTLNFGNVAVGTSQSQTATISAGTAPVTLSAAAVNSSQFSVSGLSLPLTLAAGGTASFTVSFKPQAAGTASANISFASNATNTPAVESVSGSGTVATVQHSVTLSWIPSSSVISGYNIYRGGVSGGPYTKVNSALDAGASYSDTSVQAGQTYYYVVTAVDGSGESADSNQVQVLIPSP